MCSAKCSDMFNCNIGNREHNGYVPKDIGLGGSDYVEIDYCLECGQIQGNWPLEKAKIEEPSEKQNLIKEFVNKYKKDIYNIVLEGKNNSEMFIIFTNNDSHYLSDMQDTHSYYHKLIHLNDELFLIKEEI